MIKTKQKKDCLKCDCEYDIEWEYDPANIVTSNLTDFIDRQDHWQEFNAPSICLQLLTTIFKIVYYLAPDNIRANQMILDVMEDFNGEESGNS